MCLMSSFTRDRQAPGALLLGTLLSTVAAAESIGAPLLTVDRLETAEDTALSARLTTDEPATFRLVRKPAHGKFALEPSGKLTWTPPPNFAGQDTFEVELRAGKSKRVREVTLVATPVNDLPVARPVSLRTDEDTRVSGASAVTDVDREPLHYALDVAPAHGKASVDATTGALTYEPAADFHGTDQFTVEVMDTADRVTFSVSVTVAGSNDAPVVEAGTFTLDEDGSVSGKVVATDDDGDKLTFRLERKPRVGQVKLDAKTGAFSRAPPKDFHGSDAFSVAVSDGKKTVEAEQRLEVRSINDGPVASNQSLKAAEDEEARGVIPARDVDATALRFTVVERPVNGTAIVDASTGAVTYQGAPDFHGSDRFTVEVSDGELAAPSEVTVKVTPVNDGPTLAAASFTLEEDGRLDTTLSATDVDGDPLSWRVAKGPAHGEATLDAATGKLAYVPARDFAGADAVTVEVSDGKRKASAVMALEATAVNDGPVAKPLTLVTREDQPVRGKVEASDVDSPLRFSVVVPAQHGEALVDEESGAVRYTSVENFNGDDRFTVEVGDGTLAVRTKVSVTVSAVNDPPVAPPVTLTVAEDGKLDEQLAFSDADGDRLKASLIKPPRQGTARVSAGGRLTWAPPKDFHGADALTVEVSDGEVKSTCLVSLVVTPVNDPPKSEPLALATKEDVPTSSTVVARDVDGDTLAFFVKEPPARGTATVDAASGLVTYTPGAEQSGADAFVVEVSDGTASSAAPVRVKVAAVDDAPVVAARPVETPEDAPVEGVLPATEVDGQKLTFRLLAPPRLGTATLLDAASGAFRYVPAAERHGDDEVAFSASDGKLTTAGVVKVRVTPVNDAPVVQPLMLRAREGVAVEGTLSATDVDGDALTFSVVAQPKGGKVSWKDEATGAFRFEPARHSRGTVSFQVQVSDGRASSRPETVTVTVEGVNTPPVATSAARTVKEDEVLHATAGASDDDREPLSFRVVQPPSHGALELDEATGAYGYTPAENFSGQDSFTFTATDAAGASSTGTERLTIMPVNDPPVGADGFLSVPRAGTTTGRLEGYDRDSAKLTFEVVSPPRHGQFKLVDPTTGVFTYSCDASRSEPTEVHFVVSDGEKTSAPGVLRIVIRSQ